MSKPSDAALCPECEGRGEVPATPGQPGDGPEPCPACSELTRCSEECWRAGWCDKSCERPGAVAVPRRKQDAAASTECEKHTPIRKFGGWIICRDCGKRLGEQAERVEVGPVERGPEDEFYLEVRRV